MLLVQNYFKIVSYNWSAGVARFSCRATELDSPEFQPQQIGYLFVLFFFLVWFLISQ